MNRRIPILLRFVLLQRGGAVPGLAKCKWQEIEIKINADGSPALCLHGQALQAQMDAGLGSPRISLSHSAQQAVAAVIATKG